MSNSLFRYVVWSLFLGSILAAPSAWSQQSDTTVCDGLTGAAWGLCRSAVTVGCDDPTHQNEKACENIAKSFKQVTGDEPSWLNPCPCGFTEPALAIISGIFAGDDSSSAHCDVGTSPKGGHVTWGVGGQATDANGVLWFLGSSDGINDPNQCSNHFVSEEVELEDQFYPDEQDFEQTTLNCRRRIAKLAELVQADPNDCVLP